MTLALTHPRTDAEHASRPAMQVGRGAVGLETVPGYCNVYCPELAFTMPLEATGLI